MLCFLEAMATLHTLIYRKAHHDDHLSSKQIVFPKLHYCSCCYHVIASFYAHYLCLQDLYENVLCTISFILIKNGRKFLCSYHLMQLFSAV